MSKSVPCYRTGALSLTSLYQQQGTMPPHAASDGARDAHGSLVDCLFMQYDIGHCWSQDPLVDLVLLRDMGIGTPGDHAARQG